MSLGNLFHYPGLLSVSILAILWFHVQDWLGAGEEESENTSSVSLLCLSWVRIKFILQRRELQGSSTKLSFSLRQESESPGFSGLH